MPLSSLARGTTGKAVSSAVGAVLALVAGETALRATGFEHQRVELRRPVWSAPRDREMQSGAGLYQYDPICLWSPRPGALLPWTDSERINGDGFRGPEIALERERGRLRILGLGGGAMLGVGVRWEDTFCARTVQILGEQGVPAEVLCAGSEEHTIVQGLERWHAVVRAWRPHVVVCTLLGQREILPAPQGRSDRELLEELRAQPRTTRAPGWRDELRVAHLASWLRDLASGVLWRERDLEFVEARLARTYGALDWPGERRVHYDDYVAALAALVDEARAEGATTILLSLPRAPHLPDIAVLDVYQKGAARIAEERGAILIDGRNTFLRAVVDEQIPKEELFQSDLLPSECGHLAIAQALADEILWRIRERRR